MVDANRCTELLDLCESWARANGSDWRGMSVESMYVGRAERGGRPGRQLCWEGVIGDWRDWLWIRSGSGKRESSAAERLEDLEIADRY